MNVLVVEDEVKMAALIRRGLSEEGLTVDVAGNGEEALGMARASDYDAIVLDVILPGIDGFETCRALRREGVWAPVLMLTARGALEDRVAGLDGGADDYLTKPFSFAELLARLRALVRRGQSERPSIVEVGDLRLDPATHQVWRGETEIELSAKEFVLLETFMRRAGPRAHPHAAARAGLGVRLRAPLQRDRGLHPLPAPQDRRALRGQVAGDRARRRLPTAKGRRPLSRLSIRLRVTLVFAAVMALVLGATGVFVYLRFAAELDATINAGLRSRAGDVAALVREADSGLREGHRNLVGRERELRRGARRRRPGLDSSPAVGGHVLLTPAELRRALRGPIFLDRGPLPGPRGRSRACWRSRSAAGGGSRSSSSAPRPRRATSRSPTSRSCS